MLKNDMRKCIIAEKTFDEFLEVYGPSYEKEFSLDTMRRCWDNTQKLVDTGEWHRYLKNKAANYVHYLELIVEAMDDEGIEFRGTRAGYQLARLIREQIYKTK